MFVAWKRLVGLGFVFWSLLCYTDLLGDSSWRKCSNHLEDILNGQLLEMTKRHQDGKIENYPSSAKGTTSWSSLLWNVGAFLCSLIFCTMLRSLSWMTWRMIKTYNFLRTKKLLPKESESDSNCKLIFKNQLYTTKQEFLAQDNVNLTRELEDVKKEKNELAQQVLKLQKENLTARQQIEEYKLETFMMKEKLARTACTLKENQKYKDVAAVNQEIVTRKVHSLESHLKEVNLERDILRNKLSSLEKSYSKLEEKLKSYGKVESDTNTSQYPEKDSGEPPADHDIDICEFQKKIMELRRSMPENQNQFDRGSKISVDLDDSTSKENEESSENRQSLKTNILNYSAYKAQMLKPKFKLSDVNDKRTTSIDTGSSSEEISEPQRIISSTVEFQNFLKTLTSNSASAYNFRRNVY